MIVHCTARALSNGGVMQRLAEPLPDGIETLKAMLLARGEELAAALAEAATLRARVADDQALMPT